MTVETRGRRPAAKIKILKIQAKVYDIFEKRRKSGYPGKRAIFELCRGTYFRVRQIFVVFSQKAKIKLPKQLKFYFLFYVSREKLRKIINFNKSLYFYFGRVCDNS